MSKTKSCCYSLDPDGSLIRTNSKKETELEYRSYTKDGELINVTWRKIGDSSKNNNKRIYLGWINQEKWKDNQLMYVSYDVFALINEKGEVSTELVDQTGKSTIKPETNPYKLPFCFKAY